MNKLIPGFTLTYTAVLLAAAAPSVKAQDQTVTATFEVQNLNLALTGFSDGARPVRITNKDLLNVAAATAGVPANARGGRLLIVTPADNAGPSAFVLRTGSGKKATDTDVTGLFTSQVPFSVQKSKTTSRGTTGTQYGIGQFSFGTAPDAGGTPTAVSFDVQGFTTTGLANQAMTANVNGTGSINGASAVLRGNLGLSGSKTETQVTSLNPPPGG